MTKSNWRNELYLGERVGGAGTLVRQGIKVGGKKGGRAVQKGQDAAVRAGQGAKEKVKQGNQKKMVGDGKYEKRGALIGGLAGGTSATTLLGEADITAVFFEQEALSQGDTGTVVVIYNEQVDVSGTVTLAVTGSVTGAITATYARGTGSNRLEFDFTVPSQAEVLSIADQTIGGAGSVKDKGTTVDSEDAFAGKTIGAGGSGTDLTLTIS